MDVIRWSLVLCQHIPLNRTTRRPLRLEAIMSLLQDVLRSHTPDTLDKKLRNISLSHAGPLHNTDKEDSDDELVNVISLPGTPNRSRVGSRAPSPTRGAATRPLPGPLHIHRSHASATDPLKALPTEVSQRIFNLLSTSELARCAQVSRKWSRSQTINYVWFQHYRKDNFQDDSLPPGKWTKRESKQNWRIIYLQPSYRLSHLSDGASRNSSPSLSGYQTPRELKEEKWRLESEANLKPGKVEMRSIYKELGGRKARGKVKLGSAGVRDKGGWVDEGY